MQPKHIYIHRAHTKKRDIYTQSTHIYAKKAPSLMALLTALIQARPTARDGAAKKYDRLVGWSNTNRNPSSAAKLDRSALFFGRKVYPAK